VTEPTQQPKTADELIADMENAFRTGELGLTALAIWELTHRFPNDASVARIYTKKLMRDPEFSSLSLEQVRANCKQERNTGDPETLSQLAAMGLLRFPKDRYLSLNLIEASEKLGRPEWGEAALEGLGEPERDDIVLLNAHAALAQSKGDHQRAVGILKKLLSLEPDNEDLKKNLSGALAGLGDFDQAIAFLEKLLETSDSGREIVNRLTRLYNMAGSDVSKSLLDLDRSFFAGCETFEQTRTHIDINIFLQDFEKVAEGYKRSDELVPNPVTIFRLAEAELNLGKFSDGLDHYGIRFEAFPRLAYIEPTTRRYSGEVLNDETLLVWAEQGLGDEILFSYFLEVLATRVKNVTVAMDPRLLEFFSPKYPDWVFMSRFDLAESLPNTDYACPAGDLFTLFLQELVNEQYEFAQPLISCSEQRLAEIKRLLPPSEKPRIGISWRGGQGIHGKIRSLDLPSFMHGLGDDQVVEIISFQYDEGHEDAVIAHGDRRIALSGLNNRQDLQGVISLLSQCDAVITIDNSVAHLAAAVGVPTFVLIPAGQVQFRWKNADIKNLCFPNVTLCRQSIPGDWSDVTEDAWRRALSA
jgi:tetratricopeptide (TPR) repeat protein